MSYNKLSACRAAADRNALGTPGRVGVRAAPLRTYRGINAHSTPSARTKGYIAVKKPPLTSSDACSSKLHSVTRRRGISIANQLDSITFEKTSEIIKSY